MIKVSQWARENLDSHIKKNHIEFYSDYIEFFYHAGNYVFISATKYGPVGVLEGTWLYLVSAILNNTPFI